MKTRYTRAALVAAGLIVLYFAVVGPSLRAQAPQTGKPLTAGDFEQAAPRGFGDRNNSWAQSMIWWHKNLYVGTARQSLCSSLFSVWEFATGLLGPTFADTFLPYPPPNSTLSCAPDGADLSLQAEIWRWRPGNETWQRVFQSPLDLDNPGTGAPAPPRTGKKLPYEIAFRGFTAHTDPDGTEALYAFGVNSTVMWDRTKLPPPRILRSTDGLNFAPIPQTPGTFLGDLPFNPDHSSFRSSVSFGGKLFVLSGPIFGQGSLIASADPAKGNNAWFLAAPPELVFYEMGVFNGWLYVGTFDPVGAGYSIAKTRAVGPPPYQFITVVPGGAYLPVRPSRSVVSMHEYAGRLYVGTASQTEMIRINPDDTWDLLVGPPRMVPAPGGGAEWKYPLSGLDAGFGHSLNDHAWQMDDPYKFLYVGTYNAAIGSANDPVYGPLLRHNMGAHLYRTRDGWYYSAVTTNGFANAADPFGGPFDYGIRTMVSTPHGVFLGTVNDSYGLAIFRAKPRWSPDPQPPDPPYRLEIEPTRFNSALLSWQPAPGATKYQIWRAEIHPIFVRDDLNFEAWNGVTGNKIPDTYIGPYEQIAQSVAPTYSDPTVQSGHRYMYYVLVEAQGGVSDQSNLVTFPLLTPPVTFAQLLGEVDRWNLRQRFADPVVKMTRLRQQIVDARTLAERCQIPQAIKTLNLKKPATFLQEPEATDLDALLSKLTQRLTLFKQIPQDVISSEFCTSP